MGVADAILPLNGGYEFVDQRVRRRRRGTRPDLRLQVLDQLLVRRVEFHPGRQPHPVLHMHASSSSHNNNAHQNQQQNLTKVVAGLDVACEVMITYQFSVDLVATLGAAGRVRHVLPVLLNPQADEPVAATAAASCSCRCCTIHGCCLKFSSLPRPRTLTFSASA